MCNIYMDFGFHVRARTCEKHLTGKQSPTGKKITIKLQCCWEQDSTMLGCERTLLEVVSNIERHCWYTCTYPQQYCSMFLTTIIMKAAQQCLILLCRLMIFGRDCNRLNITLSDSLYHCLNPSNNKANDIFYCPGLRAVNINVFTKLCTLYIILNQKWLPSVLITIIV